MSKQIRILLTVERERDPDVREPGLIYPLLMGDSQAICALRMTSRITCVRKSGQRTLSALLYFYLNLYLNLNIY